MASKRSAWQRNGWPRIVAASAALLAAAGVYGLVQANPKPGTNAPVTPAATTTSAPQPAVVPRNNDLAPSPAFGQPQNSVPQPPAQPQPRPHMRTRAS